MNDRRLGFEAADLVVIGFALLVAAIGTVFRERLPDSSVVARYLLVAVGYAAVVRLMVRKNVGPGWQALVRAVACSSLIPYMFLQLGNVLPHVVSHTYERELHAIDTMMFAGTEPLTAMQQWLHPVAVDVLQAAYVMYYPLFLCGLFILTRHGTTPTPRDFRDFYGFMTAVALVQCGTYLGYFLVPAMSPYRIAPLPEYAGLYDFTQPVYGRYVQPWLGAWIHDSETCLLDCFPSGHTAGALVTLLGMWKFRRPVFWAILPIEVALIVATVYLRYHYVVDVLAGLVVGVACLYGGIALSERVARGADHELERATSATT